MKLGQGYVFTGVCDSVNRGEYLIPPQEQTPRSRHPLEQTPPRADTHPGADTPQSRHPLREQTPPEQTPSRPACCEIRSTRGRYASYWNAILFSLGVHFASMSILQLPSECSNDTDLCSCSVIINCCALITNPF